jgi:hypothetical protein
VRSDRGAHSEFWSPPPLSGRRRIRGERYVRGVLYILLLLGFARPAPAQQVLTQAEALKLAFPAATEIERRTAYLTDEELARVRATAGPGVEVRQGVVTYYFGTRGNETLGVAYFDVHRVRTLPEVVMIVVSPRATVARIEILKFSEPPEYRAPDGWLRQFQGRDLSEGVSLKRGIVGITGATLTSDAVTDAVRRVLALHAAIQPMAENLAPVRR